MTSIRDIAKMAGVSPGVVSRIINQDPTLRVSVNTRSRVKSIIAKNNYTPRKTSRQEIVILMAFSKKRVMNDPYFSDLLNGILYYCKQNNLKVLTTIWLPDNDSLSHLDRLKGVLVVGPFTTSAIINMKRIANSFVLVDDNTSVPRTNQIKSNFDDITREILNGFIDDNRTRISFVGGAIERINGSGKIWDNLIDLRLSTYYEWTKRHSIVPDIINVGLTINDGKLAAQQLLKRRSQNSYTFPNAIIALNDLLARGMADEFSANGIKIPEDLCIVSFDDLSITRIRKPTITSVKIPTDELANASVRLLRDQINHSLIGTNIITVPGSIIYRDSFQRQKKSNV
ncbi:HTH-type transcriptional regulator LacR [Lentilactobacillus sunkii]|jgi:LacI family transcriptional regulator|uniref:HTH-type transcriptional regulator LacR n=1 Tax=Lentilactobacillus sunkii TaxID=481719 RepID=A0A1E7XJG4_9LACO|nr:LacI family DNA-binding transcriptional regulator [Lentilactobacillus sunkii]OFA13209.1 HTH-type transcriptional regulator LacR [Lentilactobacillus sunkii]